MSFEKIDFKTVFLQINDLYQQIQDGTEKSEVLLTQYKATSGKSLIYAGTFTEIDNLRTLFSRDNIEVINSDIIGVDH